LRQADEEASDGAVAERTGVAVALSNHAAHPAGDA
jgi:ATP-binding cassette, subfamily B, bacterial